MVGLPRTYLQLHKVWSGTTMQDLLKLGNGISSLKVIQRTFSCCNRLQRSKYTLEVREQKIDLQKTKVMKYSDDYVRKQIARFKLDKRRVANMMGDDPNVYTEKDVDRAIRYLLPSDLDKDSLPRLEDPTNIYTSLTKVQSDEKGRPLHYLYYTTKPNFFDLMHEVYQRVLDLRIKEGIIPAEKQELDLSGSRWMTKEELEDEVLDKEIIQEYNYRQILAQFEQLLQEENAFTEKDFIMKIRKNLPVVSITEDLKQPEVGEDGRLFIEEEGRRKTSIAHVKLISPGTGKITVNNQSYLKFFTWIDDRQTVIAPFCFLDKVLQFDVEATVEGAVWTAWRGSGTYINESFPKAARACAIRAGIAKALRSFISKDEVEMMRRAGLLTEDWRHKERKLPGQVKARKKYTWKKR